MTCLGAISRWLKLSVCTILDLYKITKKKQSVKEKNGKPGFPPRLAV